MTTKFVAPVIALVLLVIASSVGKPLGGKKLVFWPEKPASAYVCRSLDTQMAREAEHVHSFFRCVSLPSACTKSCAMSNSEEQEIVLHELSSFL